jgi:hypothetical protein
MAAEPTIVFDFINKTVVTAGTSAESDRRIQDFLKLQQLQAGAGPARPAA